MNTSTACTSCGKTTEPDWSTCPYCAAPTTPSCPSCERAVDPDWVACPFCSAGLAGPEADGGRADVATGDGAAGPTPPVLDRPAEEVSLLVMSRIEATLIRERNHLVERINHSDYARTDDFRDFADDLSDHVARDLGAYAARLGLHLKVDADAIHREMGPFESRLSRALERLAAAVAEARAADIPETQLDGFMQGAQIGLLDVGGHAAAGAMIGSIVPGIGTAIGGAVGGWYASHKREKEVEAVLDGYNRAFEDVASVVDQAEAPVYSAVAKAAPALIPGPKMERVRRALAEKCERADRLYEAGEPARAFEALTEEGPSTEYEDAYGPVTRRVFNHVGNLLTRTEEMRAGMAEAFRSDGVGGTVLEDFHYDAHLLEAFADTCAFVGEGEQALAAVRAAREVGGDPVGLAVSEARAHLALGDPEAALADLDRAAQEGASIANLALLRAEALAASGDRDGAAEALADAVGITFSLAGLLASLEEEGTADLLGEGALRDLYGSNRVAEMVGRWFTRGDGCYPRPAVSFDKLKAARDAYVDGVDDGRVLLLLDDTVWGSGKNGVAVTADRVIWRPLWGEAAWLEVSDDGHGAYAEADGEGALKLYVDGEEVDVPCPADHQPALARLINALA